MTIHPGTPVLVRAPRGRGLPSYAMVVRTLTPHIVRVIITADSGGRHKGAVLAVPRATLQRRARGCHRRAKPLRRRWRQWALEFGNS